MTVRVGITGVSGYGGRELLRLCAGHPAFEVVYVCGDSSAGKRLDAVLPQLAGHPLGALPIQRFEPGETGGLDVLFASLPTGQSREPLARVPAGVKVVDVGGDHRFAAGWTYGLTELPGARREIAEGATGGRPRLLPGDGPAGPGPPGGGRAGGAGGGGDRRQERRQRGRAGQ